MAVNTNYKDSVFSFLFSDPDTLRELYAALEGVPVDPALPVTINTLSDALYMSQYNDISFVIGNKIVVLIEHQSTINPNMPLRLLLYIARVYEKILEEGKKGAVYRERLILIPLPVFIVLYNGPKPFPDQMTLRLSDAFEAAGLLKAAGSPVLELEVKVYNINPGHNEGILKRCRTLQGYSAFTSKVREYRKAMPLADAMKAGVKYCLEHGILKEFLVSNTTEVFNMLTTEWDIDEAREVWLEEGWENGWEEGLEKGLEKGREEERKNILALIKQGYSAEQIEGMLPPLSAE
jgi:hypothetical protein